MGDRAGPGREIFFEVHTDLPREGPGNRSSTARALAATGILTAEPRVLDIGCGPGMQTMDLAALLPSARITAVDAHQPYVDMAAALAIESKVADRVTARQADMRALPFEPGSFELLWCEGAAYIMGVARALQAWRPLLTPGGCLAFTDAVWLTEDPPEELLRWWQTEYAEMASVAGCLERVRSSGYEVLDSFVLPEAAWWDDYYQPMERRLQRLREKYAGQSAALAAVAESQREIDYYRRWSAHYGYLFVVAGLSGA